MKYVVLMDISPGQGPIIKAAGPDEPPTVVDEAVLFAIPSEQFSNEERARILMNKGVIAPADDLNKIEEAKIKVKETEREAARSLKSIT